MKVFIIFSMKRIDERNQEIVKVCNEMSDEDLALVAKQWDDDNYYWFEEHYVE